MASEKSEDIRDEIAAGAPRASFFLFFFATRAAVAGEGYARRLKDELMHKGLMPCTSPAYKGDAPSSSTFGSFLSRFARGRAASPAKAPPTGGGDAAAV